MNMQQKWDQLTDRERDLKKNRYPRDFATRLERDINKAISHPDPRQRYIYLHNLAMLLIDRKISEVCLRTVHGMAIGISVDRNLSWRNLVQLDKTITVIKVNYSSQRQLHGTLFSGFLGVGYTAYEICAYQIRSY